MASNLFLLLRVMIFLPHLALEVAQQLPQPVGWGRAVLSSPLSEWEWQGWGRCSCSREQSRSSIFCDSSPRYEHHGMSQVCLHPAADGRLSSSSFAGSSLMANVSNKAKEMFFQWQSHAARVARSFQRVLPKGWEVRRLVLYALETLLARCQGSGTGCICLFWTAQPLLPD